MNLKEGVAGVYAKRFSAAELQKTAAFHASPEGRKIVRLQKELYEADQQVGLTALQGFFKTLHL